MTEAEKIEMAREQCEHAAKELERILSGRILDRERIDLIAGEIESAGELAREIKSEVVDLWT